MSKNSKKSRYRPERDTVGAIYRDAQLSYDGTPILVGDMCNELMKGLVEDLNDTIQSDPFEGKSFFITIHEKKDLQMKTTFLRRLIVTRYRPYPEDDTTVFWAHPSSGDVRFCWCLPHWSEMSNMLANSSLFEPALINEIMAWKREDLAYFGFRKNEMGNWEPNPNWEDKKLEKPEPKKIPLFLPAA